MFQKKLMSQFQENLQPDRRTNGRTDRKTDRPYFIGPIRLRLGVIQEGNL